MINSYFFKKTRGMGLVEVIVAITIVSAFIVVIFLTNTIYLKTALSNIYTVKSAFLLEEGIEAIKIIRDGSWVTNISPLPDGATRYLSFSGGTWHVSTANIYIDNEFERRFVINNVNRNSSDEIVESGGVLDAGTKKVTVYVSWWNGKATTTKSMATYITDIL